MYMYIELRSSNIPFNIVIRVVKRTITDGHQRCQFGHKQSSRPNKFQI